MINSQSRGVPPGAAHWHTQLDPQLERAPSSHGTLAHVCAFAPCDTEQGETAKMR